METQDLFRNILGENDLEFEISAVWNHSPAPTWSIVHRTLADNVLLITRDGGGHYEIDGVQHAIIPGRVFLVSREIPYSAVQDNAFPLSAISVRFSAYERGKKVECFPVCALVYDPINAGVLFGILSALCGNVLRYPSEIADDFICNGLMKAFFHVLHADWNASSNRQDKLMEHIGQVIDASIRAADMITLSRLLDIANISRYEFSSRFTKYFKMTLRDYLFKKRLNYSAELLQTTSFSIKKIAITIGYSDQYIFSNQFKSVYGVSPKIYREKRILLLDN